mmetsp:Transcript_425/g.654  ORF Transcript_425/g.654 Transcript_425/m.654 type:complete len:153 (+) Transcript_425:18-476(+)
MASELDLAVVGACQAVVKYLDDNARSELAAAAIRPMALMKLPEEADKLLDLAQDLGLCDAYIDHQELVGVLADARDKTCQWYEVERKKLYRKVNKLVENKAEAEEVAAATMKRDEHEVRCPAVSTKYYQLRALTAQDWSAPLPAEDAEEAAA